MENLIIYDGKCALCSYFLESVLKRDNGIFKIIDRHSFLFNNYKEKYNIIETNGESIYFIKDHTLYKESEAIIQILKLCGGVFRSLAYLLQFTPIKIRNMIYRMVAKNRYYINSNKSCNFNQYSKIQKRLNN